MSRKRILIPHRIIPTELYVQRDADRQLRSILDDMASPGYVLVARQMGKTNMLLNAKRSYQTENDVYTYVDLSNSFGTEGECFRHIIDKSIDTHQKLIGFLKPAIKQIRDERLPPHLEHLQELRAILNYIGGKMVIILDEIDALTRSTFSDKIFSQVRSIYFERDSYDELCRLTYVLSGVVEPTEIIKNPKISPFNIGEKIFLDDFSRVEHDEFIKKAQLHLDQSVSDRIFYWTSGNPRMTYDICSDTELQLENNAISATTIDSIVKKLYLTNFDKAPVDHIRELVTNDKTIRDALLLIRYGNGSKIEDHVKTKLYLSGIIGPDFTSDDLGIKNRIIDLSLSEAWIGNLEKQAEKPVEIVERLAKAGEFKQVTEYYLKLSETEVTELPNNAKYNIVLAYYKNGEFIKAVDLFMSVNYDKNYELLGYLDNLLYLADSYERNGNYDKAIIAYKEVIENDQEGKFGMMSMVNLAEIYIDFEGGKHRDKSYDLLNTALNSEPVSEMATDPDFHRQLMVSANLFYGKLLNKSGRSAEAINALDKALAICDDNTKPVIMLVKLNFSKSPESSLAELNKIINLIIEQQLLPDPINNSDIYFSQQTLYEVMDKVMTYLPQRFDELCTYLIDKFAEQKTVDYLFGFYEIGVFASRMQNLALTTSVFEFLLLDQRSHQVDESALFPAYRLILSSEFPVKDIEAIMSNYYEFLASHPKLILTSVDLDTLINYADREIAKHDFSRSQAVLTFLNSSLDKTPDNLWSSKYLIEFMEIKAINYSFSDVARERSKHLLNSLNRLTQQEISGNPLLKNSITMLKNSLATLSYVSPPMLRKMPSIGDGDRVSVQYTNGRVIKDIKFKKVKNDIARGSCRVI
ncbi:MAG: repeat-containing protein [Segetibacter sp.]|nr:repeat-containing protein [Segetibacter sp.]